MRTHQPVPPRSTARRRAVWLLLWLALICGTSSTVVTPTQFFNAISEYLLREESAFRAFAIFWGACWFFIVKGWHAAEFAILFLLLNCFASVLVPRPPDLNRGIAFLAACLLAMFDEWRQTFVPERGGTWIDVLIDCLGASIAFAWTTWALGRQTRNSPGEPGA